MSIWKANWHSKLLFLGANFLKKLQRILSVIIRFLVNGFPTVGTIYLTQSPKVALVLLLQHLMSTEAGGGREVGGARICQ